MTQIISLLCGGMSPEHEISILSAKNVAKNLDPKRYHLQIVYLSKDGKWWLIENNNALINCGDSTELLQAKKKQVLPDLGSKPAALKSYSAEESFEAGIIIPMLHGAGGEDGSVQGLLQLWQVEHIGAKVLGSAVSMHKSVTKNLLTQAGVACVPWQLLNENDLQLLEKNSLKIKIDLPLFVKPADTGSSIGVSKVESEDDLIGAIQDAFKFSSEVLLEPVIKGRELECAVLAGMNQATVPGEIIVNADYEFYDYAAKYEAKDGAATIVPAKLGSDIAEKIREIALQAARAVYCLTMARVDFFLSDDGMIYVNEVNSIPGFTDISMYSKMWAHEGLSMSQLLDHLIEGVVKSN